MKFTIWKEELKRVAGSQELAIPRGAEILCVREHQGRACIWFQCDPAEMSLESRKIALVETGKEAPGSHWRYLGTMALSAGQLVVHAFERAANGNGKR